MKQSYYKGSNRRFSASIDDYEEYIEAQTYIVFLI